MFAIGDRVRFPSTHNRLQIRGYGTAPGPTALGVITNIDYSTNIATVTVMVQLRNYPNQKIKVNQLIPFP
jgi:hypothetical protein